ncbi:MAG: LytTR family transcriptional regulator [Bacteroidales bacterium]|nr:LytTR family transcriptional regulator [Bacteroidales bacterium]
MNFINYINQPFPKAESKWKTIISISVFVTLFLIVFQPFGINLFKSDHKLLILSGYGLVTFFTLIFDLILIENIFSRSFNDQNWKIWKEFTWLIWVIFSIGIGNALFSFYIFDNFHFSLKTFISFEIITLIVGVIPITILIITKQKFLLKKHLTSSNNLNKNILIDKIKSDQKQIIRFYADNEKDFIEFDINNFAFIESSGNYVEIHFFEENTLIKKTFRSTLKRALSFFDDNQKIIQCHRAYIVNINRIISSKGNSQGLKLSLENCEQEIPVSRGFVDRFRENQ